MLERARLLEDVGGALTGRELGPAMALVGSDDGAMRGARALSDLGPAVAGADDGPATGVKGGNKSWGLPPLSLGASELNGGGNSAEELK